jgi:hypothetical protein
LRKQLLPVVPRQPSKIEFISLADVPRAYEIILSAKEQRALADYIGNPYSALVELYKFAGVVGESEFEQREVQSHENEDEKRGSRNSEVLESDVNKEQDVSGGGQRHEKEEKKGKQEKKGAIRTIIDLTNDQEVDNFFEILKWPNPVEESARVRLRKFCGACLKKIDANEVCYSCSLCAEEYHLNSSCLQSCATTLAPTSTISCRICSGTNNETRGFTCKRCRKFTCVRCVRGEFKSLTN